MSGVVSSNVLLAVAYRSHKLRLIDLRTGSASHTLKGHNNAVIALAWSTKDSHILASGG